MADTEKESTDALESPEEEPQNGDADDISTSEIEPGHEDQASGILQADENFKIVAAIDFGTTFSGYAYSFADDSERIYTNKNWGQTQGFLLHKTPTCLLLSPSGEFNSFGFEAVSKYNDLSEEDAEEYYYFDRFKMKLYDNKVRK